MQLEAAQPLTVDPGWPTPASRNGHRSAAAHKVQIAVPAGEFVTCPYPTTANFQCRQAIPVGEEPLVRCPGCGRSL
jgi:hypothetical protein